MVCVWASCLLSKLCCAFGFVFHHRLSSLVKNYSDFRAFLHLYLCLVWAPRKKSSGHPSCAPLQVRSTSRCVPLSMLRSFDYGRWM